MNSVIRNGYLLRIYDKERMTGKWICTNWQGSYISLEEAKREATNYFNQYKNRWSIKVEIVQVKDIVIETMES